MGLIRKAIVVGGIIFAMPSDPVLMQQVGGVAQSQMDSNSWAYIAAAADTVADMKSFCDRKPQVCTTAQYLAVSMEGKAKYGVRLITDWANDATQGQVASQSTITAAADPIKTGTVKLRGTIAENNTLRMEDLVPEWHGTLDPQKG